MSLNNPNDTHFAFETELLRQINDAALSPDERAWLRCELAKRLEEIGHYDAAQEALGGLWQQVGERPQLAGLDERTAGEVLLRAGVLVGWIGSTRAVAGAQERAKNLITESIEVFKSLNDQLKTAEAQTDLAYCYWREGAFDEARIVLQDALARLGDEDSYQKAVALLRSAMVERSSLRYSDALRIHERNAPIVAAVGSDALKGKFHNELAMVLEILGHAEHRADYVDRALIEYAAASFHFEQAGHVRYHACTENNLGLLFFNTGSYEEAHAHLDQARQLLVLLKDHVHVAQVDETRARVLLAEGRHEEAEQIAGAAAQALEHSGEQHSFAEALTTQGTALARLGRSHQARLTLEHALAVAEQAGDREGMGLAALVLVEELGEKLPPNELSALYERAAAALTGTQDTRLLARLTAAARRAVRRLTFLRENVEWEGYSLRREVERYEEYMIRRALKDSGGAVSHAARLLGFRYHQALVSLLNTRFKHLLRERLPVKPRKKKDRARLRGLRDGAPCRAPARTIRILHVEDDKLVAGVVGEMLELEGWQVDLCMDGAAALAKIESAEHYDLILLDYDLPRVGGLELARRVRQLHHRSATPIVMLSASPVSTEALRGSVDAFLKKPEDIGRLADTIGRLLSAREVG
jgi:CheY-like chemotaxis protein